MEKDQKFVFLASAFLWYLFIWLCPDYLQHDQDLPLSIKLEIDTLINLFVSYRYQLNLDTIY